MNQAAEAWVQLAHPRAMDRLFATALFIIALLSLGGAGLLLLNDFIEYLQSGRWRVDSLLDAGYDLRLLNSRWFLASDLGSAVRDLLQRVPTFAALLVLTPLAWWLSNRLGAR